MYKEIFQIIVLMASQPGRTWARLAKWEDKKDDYLSRFVYPLIGMMSLAAFLGVLFTRKEFDIQIALKDSIRVLIQFAGGFYLASVLLREVMERYFHIDLSFKQCQRFVAYASCITYALQIVLTLIPEFFFLQIFGLYAIYIIYEGAEVFMQIQEATRMKFMIIASIVILGAPAIVKVIISFLMPSL